jgi:NADP-dependent 3-hydroxy acid dehydrogenase YdfG
MDRRISTVLIIGATSGIGEGYARRFYSMGKKVIITGRRADRLSALKQELTGIETRQVDQTSAVFGAVTNNRLHRWTLQISLLCHTKLMRC